MTTWKTFLLTEALLLGAMLPACLAGPAFTADDSTVALWNFDEGEGDVLKDGGPAGIDLVFREQTNDRALPEWTDGKFGKALHFPGGASLRVQNTKVGIIDTPEEVTLEAWIRLIPQETPSGRAIFQHASMGKAGFRMFVNVRNKIDWSIVGGDGKEIGAHGVQVLPENEWIHVAGTYDGTHLRIYVNGLLDAEHLVEGGVIQREELVATTVGIAQSGDLPYFVGDIDAIRISNKARTDFPTE